VGVAGTSTTKLFGGEGEGERRDTGYREDQHGSPNDRSRQPSCSGRAARQYATTFGKGLLSAGGARTFLDRSSVNAFVPDTTFSGRHHLRQAATIPADGAEGFARERDDLRARVIELQEAVLRLRAAADLQRRADAERATQVGHLNEALSAADRAGELHRRAAAELEEAVADVVCSSPGPRRARREPTAWPSGAVELAKR
jgi:hypothetical protein